MESGDNIMSYQLQPEDFQLNLVRLFREVLSIEKSPPVDEVIQHGFIPLFVQFLSRDDVPELQYEATWVLGNIASGTYDHTKVGIDHGAVPLLINLLGSPLDVIREQAVWALGNVSGDSPGYRDFFLRKGALLPLLAQLDETATPSMLRNLALTLLNFCRGQSQPPFHLVRAALPALQLLVHFNDKDVLAYACWALSYLSDGSNYKIQAVIEANVSLRLVELLTHPSPHVLIPALRTIRNIAKGDDWQRQCIIDHGALLYLPILLFPGNDRAIQKEACRTISDITAGDEEQNQALIDAQLIEPLIYLLRSAESDVKKEAGQAVLKVISGATHNRIKFSGLEGFITPLCDLLGCPDPSIVTVCLEGLEILSKPSEEEIRDIGYSFFAQLIDRAEGLDRIKELQSHSNYEIREKASKVWKPLYGEVLRVWKSYELLGDFHYMR